MSDQNEINQFIDKVKSLEKGKKLDLSSDEDLSIGIMNLISIEEHLFFSGEKTKKSEYFDLLKQIRSLRTELLKKIIKDYEGEVWCVSKHLLAASMRLMEVGTKALAKGEKDLSEEMFTKSYDLFNLFWGLNLGLVKLGEVERGEKDGVNLVSEKDPKESLGSVGVFEKLGQVIKKVLDCCRE